MRIMDCRGRALTIVAVVVAVGGGCTPAAQTTSRSAGSAVATSSRSNSGPSVWSLDVMTVRPGERERYRRFLEANWAKARQTALARGEIRSFHALFTPDTSTTGTQVLLMTEYPDSAAYARREEIFQPILAAQGRTLIDGMATRELTERVENRWFVELLGKR